MFGWRARLGVVIPSANSAVESEYNSRMPAGVSLHASRVKSTSIDVEGMRAMSLHAERAVEELADASVDAIAYACTSGTFTQGATFGNELEARLSDIAGVPVITTANAVLAALRALDVATVALISPYTDEVNELEAGFLEHHGIEVTAQRGLGHRTPAVEGRLRRRRASLIGLEPLYASYAMAKRVFEEQMVEAFFISCTNFATFEVIEKIERDLGVPVVSSNQATLWALLGLARIDPGAVNGLGRLFGAAPASLAD